VVAADIYSVGDQGGRGGWTWYTGSAGWLYRAAAESILGIRWQGESLVIDPVLPTHWQGYSARLKLGGAVYDIRVERQKGIRKAAVEHDGKRVDGNSIELKPGGESQVLVRVPF